MRLAAWLRRQKHRHLDPVVVIGVGGRPLLDLPPPAARVRVTDHEGTVVYDGPAPVPADVGSVTLEELASGVGYTFTVWELDVDDVAAAMPDAGHLRVLD